MKVYSEKDLENFERDEYGFLLCPSGDYTQIKSFDARCRFGEWCRFGDNCRFGEWCRFDALCRFGECCGLENNLKFENIEYKVDRVLKIDRIGSRKGCTYFFKTFNEIYVRCGCFFGTITEFENEVNKTHANNKQYRKEYIGAIKYVKEVLR